MKELKHNFSCGEIENGQWMAISTSSPYFCFEGNSLADVEAKAGRALEFYYGAKGGITTRPPSSI